MMSAKKNFLNFKIEDFGSIKEANLEIKPLTVFIGPNNSGKSYASLLFHSFTSHDIKISKDGKTHLRSNFSKKEQEEIEELRQFFYKETFNDLTKYTKNQHYISKPFIIHSNVFNELIYKITRILYNNRLERNISSFLGEDLDKLRRNNENEFSINFQDINFLYSDKDFKNLKSKIILNDHIIFNDDDIFVEIKNGEFNFKIEPHYIDSKRKDHLKILEQEDEEQIRDIKNLTEMIHLLKSEPEFYVLIEYSTSIFEVILDFIINALFGLNSYYIPAGKNEISNYLKFFASQNLAIKNEDFPQTLGFLANDLINMDYEEKTIFYNLATDLENELFRGKTKVDTSNTIPKYSFLRKDGKEFENKNISSSIAELRPIILYLKHKLKKNDILIIEEPESHLHPKNQTILIKYLVRCINKGLRVLITTHSDYIIDQINNHIMLNNIKSDENKEKLLKKHNYQKHDFLDSNIVSVYAFRKNENDFSFDSHEIEITDLGIQAEDFNKIATDLYDESYDIKDLLMR